MGKTKKHTNKQVAKSYRHYLLAAACLILLLLGSASLYWYFSLKAPLLPNPPLKDLAKARGVELGIHVINAKSLDDRIYPGLISSQFSFVAIDGGIHFKQFRPTPTTYDFSAADKIVEFAQQQNMPVQLHHLLWGDKFMLPDWLINGHYSKSQILQIMHDNVTSIVKRYRGKVKEYSVVNEAFTEPRHIFKLRSWYADHLGENDLSYVDDAFKWAHQADPQAKLILNDFKNEIKNNISDAMYSYIKSAKARGVPIDGLGMQMHINATNPPKTQEVIDNMNRFAQLGVKVYVTEFDVNTNDINGSHLYKNQLQANITYNIVRACVESKDCVSFVDFALTDKNDLVKSIFRTKSRAYLFDSRFRPKPAYYSFRQAWLNQ